MSKRPRSAQGETGPKTKRAKKNQIRCRRAEWPRDEGVRLFNGHQLGSKHDFDDHDDDENSGFYVVETDGAVVATCLFEAGKIPEVVWIETFDGYRRKGYGSLLLGHVENVARGLGHNRIIAQGIWNTKFYESNGWVVPSTTMHASMHALQHHWSREVRVKQL